MTSLILNDGTGDIIVHPTSLTINESNKSYTMKIPKSDIDYTQIIDMYNGGGLTLKTYTSLTFVTGIEIDITVDGVITYKTIVTSYTMDIDAISWTYTLSIIGRDVV